VACPLGGPKITTDTGPNHGDITVINTDGGPRLQGYPTILGKIKQPEGMGMLQAMPLSNGRGALFQGARLNEKSETEYRIMKVDWDTNELLRSH
jgi:hypothetical protein